jgi:hypothetical protein
MIFGKHPFVTAEVKGIEGLKKAIQARNFSLHSKDFELTEDCKDLLTKMLVV